MVEVLVVHEPPEELGHHHGLLGERLQLDQLGAALGPIAGPQAFRWPRLVNLAHERVAQVQVEPGVERRIRQTGGDRR